MGGISKVFGYARVSLEEEKIENQIKAIEDFCKSNNLELLKVFKDIGVSGDKVALEREGFRKMLEIAEELGVKTIVVYDLTRLGRDIFDVINTMKYLYDKGFNVLFVKHPELNLSNDNSYVAQTMRRALIALLAAFAEMERSFIRERTKQGMARARAQGKHVGRKPIEIPMDLVKKYLDMGLSKKAIYQLLIDQGYLHYIEKKTGRRRVMSYDRFCKRLKKELGV